MQRVADILTPEEMRALHVRSDLMGAGLVLHAWALILAAMALFAFWPNPLTLVLAVVVIGGRQLGLAILMHDAAHGLLFRRRVLNDLVGQWLCAYPVATDLMAYRPYHLRHHRFTQQPDDPDLGLSAPFPITPASLGRKIIRDLTGNTGYHQRREQILLAWGPAGLSWRERLRRLQRSLGDILLVNLVLLTILAGAGYWWLYPALWLLPLLTWYQVISRIRNIAEHALVPDNDDRLRNTRTTLASPLMRLILAPYWVNYHLEHHLLLFVPCWRLRAAHRLLLAKGYGERMEIRRSYREVLALASSALTGGSNARKAVRSVQHL